MLILKDKNTYVEIVSNVNELKDKTIQVDKLLDEIRNFDISI